MGEGQEVHNHLCEPQRQAADPHRGADRRWKAEGPYPQSLALGASQVYSRGGGGRPLSREERAAACSGISNFQMFLGAEEVDDVIEDVFGFSLWFNVLARGSFFFCAGLCNFCSAGIRF